MTRVGERKLSWAAREIWAAGLTPARIPVTRTGVHGSTKLALLREALFTSSVVPAPDLANKFQIVAHFSLVTRWS